MAEEPGHGSTRLVRRAERLYGDRLGRFRYGELSWHVPLKWLPGFLLAGFAFGAIAQFTGQPRSSRDPALFSDLPLFLSTSLATGLVLWSMTLLWSFRRLLVFDRGLLFGYARKHTARAILWQDIDPGSLRVVEARPGIEADGLLKTLKRSTKTSLGVHGRYALVFRGRASDPDQAALQAGISEPGFFTFSTREHPVALIAAIEQGMAGAGLRAAGAPTPGAVPLVSVSTAMRLD